VWPTGADGIGHGSDAVLITTRLCQPLLTSVTPSDGVPSSSIKEKETMSTRCSLTLENGPAFVEWNLCDIATNEIEAIIRRDVSMSLSTEGDLSLCVGGKTIKDFNDDWTTCESFDRIGFWEENASRQDMYDRDNATAPEREALFWEYMKKNGITEFSMSGCIITSDGVTLHHWLSDQGV